MRTVPATKYHNNKFTTTGTEQECSAHILPLRDGCEIGSTTATSFKKLHTHTHKKKEPHIRILILILNSIHKRRRKTAAFTAAHAQPCSHRLGGLAQKQRALGHHALQQRRELAGPVPRIRVLLKMTGPKR